MSVDITVARTALQTNLQTIAGLECYRTWPEDVHPPAAMVGYGGTGIFMQRMTFDRTYEHFFDVHVIVSLAGDLEAAQDHLDAYLSASSNTSIITAIESDNDLNNSCDYAQVQSISVPGYMEINGVQYLGATARVQIVG